MSGIDYFLTDLIFRELKPFQIEHLTLLSKKYKIPFKVVMRLWDSYKKPSIIKFLLQRPAIVLLFKPKALLATPLL